MQTLIAELNADPGASSISGIRVVLAFVRDDAERRPRRSQHELRGCPLASAV